MAGRIVSPRPLWRLATAVVVVAATASLPAVAQNDNEGAPADQPLSALVRIHLPLKGNADQALRSLLLRARDRLVDQARAQQDPRRPVLVLEIRPAPGAPPGGAGSQFERALALARFVAGREMTDVKTVAYLPESIRGHGVLLAIAAEEVMMAPEAEIAEAPGDQEGGETVVAAYREIADARRTFPEALAIGLVDPSVEVVQVESDEGIRFLLGQELEEYRREHDVIDIRRLAEQGTPARFTGREGREYGFVRFLASDRAAVAQALGVPTAALEEDQSLLVDWNPIILEIRGPVTPAMASELETSLGSELARGVNWICLRIDSAGGDLGASLQIASMFAALDRNSVRTVAYVPVEARGGAAVAALACDQLVMHADARLGAGPTTQNPPPAAEAADGEEGQLELPDWLPGNDDNQAEDRLQAAVASVRTSLADESDRPWSLLAAMIDSSIDLFIYRNRATGQEELMSPLEANSRPDSEDWIQGDAVDNDAGLVVVDGQRALELDVAWQVVESFDDLKDLFGIDIEPPIVELNWAQRLVQAMAAPWFATVLVMIGFVGVYVELRSPGLGIGGFIATVAFVLFFWSKALDQTAGWLEIMLFVTGIFFILMEVFVLPGFGIFGLGGGAMVLFALILASQTFVIPRTESDLAELRRSLTVVTAAGLGVLMIAFTARRYLPHAPIFNRIVLQPPRPEERIDLESRERVVDYAHLVGQAGTATTDLRPAGKARIGDALIDVIAESAPLDRGAEIVVVDAHASRVVVRAASA